VNVFVVLVERTTYPPYPSSDDTTEVLGVYRSEDRAHQVSRDATTDTDTAWVEPHALES
jgi:hypothetical protein